MDEGKKREKEGGKGGKNSEIPRYVFWPLPFLPPPPTTPEYVPVGGGTSITKIANVGGKAVAFAALCYLY